MCEFDVGKGWHHDCLKVKRVALATLTIVDSSLYHCSMIVVRIERKSGFFNFR